MTMQIIYIQDCQCKTIAFLERKYVMNLEDLYDKNFES